MATSWVIDALPDGLLGSAKANAARRLIEESIWPAAERDPAVEGELRFVADALELAVLDLLENSAIEDKARATRDRVELASDAFHVLRSMRPAGTFVEVSRFFVRVGCMGVLGDRGADVARFLNDTTWPDLPLDSESWGDRTVATVLDLWLRTLRKNGWDDLKAVQQSVVALRESQGRFEREYLEIVRGQSSANQRQAAWQLVVYYHLAKAAELLALFTSQGEVGDGFDVREQLQAQFDYALAACSRAELVEWDSTTRLLSHTAKQLVDNSIWTATRAVNSRVSEFIGHLVSPTNPKPLFDLLPPQRLALREAGLRGGGDRAIVVNLPTSSGKTFLAEFRILQAINQFERERGWVAYLAPTRALVNQVCSRLRRDFAGMDLVVERVSPALELDTLEASLLSDKTPETQFRVLVTTPEKLDLMIRGDWEAKIGRPLTLVVVDEAHNMAHGDRGIKLELLLATINRECRNAQFLLLTPFIDNAKEVADWLSPESNSTVELSTHWAPNDRIIALSRAERIGDGRDYRILLETLHTSKETLAIDEAIPLAEGRPLGITWSKIKGSASDLASATAQLLKSRGPTIVLCARPDWCWSVARRFKKEENRREVTPNVALVQRYLRYEFGDDFDLVQLLDYGVGVHHSGLSDEAKSLLEWLFESEELDVLVATTTIAQGVNFPVAGVVIAQNTYYDGKKTVEMPAADFWNVAGRAGRADQSAAGVIALAAIDDQKADELRAFVNTQVASLNSTLVEMVVKILQAGRSLELHSLFDRPEWSAFLQYLAHTYRQINDPAKFSQQVDRILRGTLGFQKLRDRNRQMAQTLTVSAQAYGARLVGQPLSLVDSTGFSWETVHRTLGRLSEEKISANVWTPDLLADGNRDLPKLMGILLRVPELRDNLIAATGGKGPDGVMLAQMTIDWVKGVSIADLAKKYFGEDKDGNAIPETEAITDCCRNLYGKLAQTTSWGLSALQAMTLGDHLDDLDELMRQEIRNLPSKVFYGVSSSDAISLRLLGVPRTAAEPLSVALSQLLQAPVASQNLGVVRKTLSAAGREFWQSALGPSGEDYQQVWKVLEAVR